MEGGDSDLLVAVGVVVATRLILLMGKKYDCVSIIVVHGASKVITQHYWNRATIVKSL